MKNYIKQNIKKGAKRSIKKIMAVTLLAAMLVNVFSVPAMANPNNNNPMTQHGFGRAQGRSQPININDFHTDVWERFAFNYQFSSGPDYRMVLGRPTQTDIVPFNPDMQNVRRNAGAAFNPPSYGFFSGAFATERSNIFAIQSPTHYMRETTSFAMSNTDAWGFGGSGGAGSFGGAFGTTGGGSPNAPGSTMGSGMLPPTSVNQGGNGTQSNNTAPPPANTGSGSVQPPHTNTSNPGGNTPPAPTLGSTQTSATVTHIPNPAIQTPLVAPRFFDDGSMGRLSIPAIGIRSARVFHGDGYDIIDFHIGHFPTTSAWDGNVGLLAHNGGRAGYFERLHTLNIGDEIIWETPHGTRAYEVFFTQIISERDFGLLGWSHENMMTLITCVRARPGERFALVAIER